MKERTYSKTIAQAIKEFLTNDDWHYSFDEQRGLFKFGLSIKGKIKKVRYLVDVKDDAYLVYAIAPIGGDEDDRNMMMEMAEFICRANYGLKSGNFELDMDDGEIRFKCYVDCDGINPTISQQYYANLFYRNLIRQLIRHATTCSNGELPREIRFFFDDFACTCPIEGFGQDISLFRSAGLSAVMLLQSEAQLEAIYKDDASIIRQNCAVYAYFPGGFDDRSCEIVSKRMGLPYEDILYASLGKVFIMQSGRKPVHIQRYDTLNSKEYAEYAETSKLVKPTEKLR